MSYVWCFFPSLCSASSCSVLFCIKALSCKCKDGLKSPWLRSSDIGNSTKRWFFQVVTAGLDLYVHSDTVWCPWEEDLDRLSLNHVPVGRQDLWLTAPQGWPKVGQWFFFSRKQCWPFKFKKRKGKMSFWYQTLVSIIYQNNIAES